MSFDRIKKLAITPEQTSPCYVPELGPSAVLHLAHAGEINQPYYNARFGQGIRAATKAIKRKDKKAIDDVVAMETNAKRGRDMDRELFPLHIIKGWDHVLDDEDKEAEFTVENAQKVCDLLCSDPSLYEIFDRLRAHAGDTANYRDLPSGEDLEEIAKN